MDSIHFIQVQLILQSALSDKDIVNTEELGPSAKDDANIEQPNSFDKSTVNAESPSYKGIVNTSESAELILIAAIKGLIA